MSVKRGMMAIAANTGRMLKISASFPVGGETSRLPQSVAGTAATN